MCMRKLQDKFRSKVQEAQAVLVALGLPMAQQNEISALTLLALCGLKPHDGWAGATRQSVRVSKEIMDFIHKQYKRKYAPNTRETIRRQVLHQFVQARVVDYNPDKPNLPVNSPNAHYAISTDALKVIQALGTPGWDKSVKAFLSKVGSLTAAYEKQRNLTMLPVKLSNGKLLKLSAGKHNEVEIGIVNLFATRFAQGSQVLFVGDTANKDLYLDTANLRKLKIPFDQHGKFPDVILYDPKKDWLFLIEAVTSHGPISPKRLLELKTMLKKCKSGKVFVTAFPDRTEM